MLIKHVDVKTAYLNGELQETVYMKLPPGCDYEDPSLVCHLQKGLYGLKQAANIWNKKLDSVLRKLGFKPSESDPCLYSKHNDDGTMSFIAVYVDDLIIVCKSEKEHEAIFKNLNSHFKVTSLGDITHFLGIHVIRSQDGVSLNQKAYIQKLLTRFGLQDAKSSKIPLDPGYIQSKEEETERLPNNHQFASLIGGLLYIAVNTRPDIAVAVSILGRKTSNPSQDDWNEAKRVLRYLKGTIDHRLVLGIDSSQLEVFVDADWAGDSKDRKSTSGFLFRYAGGMIGWNARKQDNVTLSSTEAEYVAMADCCKELTWILRLFNDLKIVTTLPVKINEDNQSCIKQLSAPNINRRSKHIETKYHFIRQLKQDGIINPQYLPTEDMIADMMTKPLYGIKLSKFRDQARVISSRRSVEGVE